MTWRRWGCAGAVALACLCAPKPALAHGPEGTVAGILIGDVVFTTYDVVALADGERSSGWLVTQAIVTTPQALIFDLLPFDTDELPLSISIWLNQLAAFSLYGLWDKDASVSSLYGLSWAMGADAALTSYVVAAAFEGRFLPRDRAITALVATTPQIALASYAALSPDSIQQQRKTILLLGAWSAGIFAHGAASLFFYRPKSPPAAGKQAWTLAPAVVAALDGLAPALYVSGTF